MTETDAGIGIVYACDAGCVTDLGCEMVAVDAATGETVATVPRYGVWKRDGRGRANVVFVTDDLATAVAVAQVDSRKAGTTHADQN